MEFILALLILFVVARLAGEAMEQVGQSPMIGEVLAGIAIGPAVLGWIDPNPLVEPGVSLGIVAQLGVLVLVLLAGIEVGREGLHLAFQERGAVVAVASFVLPFALGYAFGLALGLTFPQSLFLGTALAVTALPISVRILMDLNLLHSRVGRAIVSAALVNDLVAFALFGLVVQFHRVGGTSPDPWTTGYVLATILLFIGLVVLVSVVLKRAMRPAAPGVSKMQALIERLRGQERGMAVSIIIALSLGAAAEAVGIHFAIGVFYGGILLGPSLLGESRFVRIRSAVSVVTFGFFAPIFFAVVGLNFTFSLSSWPLIVAVTAVAFVGKLLGGILGGYPVGFRGGPLLALGVGLNARGMMELLLAQVALSTGIIGADLYSALIVMTLVTTFTTPPLLKRIMRGFRARDVLPEIATRAKEPGG